MEVKLNKDLAKDLLKHKLRSIRGYIEEILEKWHIDDPHKFLEDVENGHYEEAENDAIDLKQLLHDHQKYQNELDRIQ